MSDSIRRFVLSSLNLNACALNLDRPDLNLDDPILNANGGFLILGASDLKREPIGTAGTALTLNGDAPDLNGERPDLKGTRRVFRFSEKSESDTI